MHNMALTSLIRQRDAAIASSWRQQLFRKSEDEVFTLVTDIDNAIDFIPTFCTDCGKEYKITGKRDRCEECYLIDLRKRKTEQKRRERMS